MRNEAKTNSKTACEYREKFDGLTIGRLLFKTHVHWASIVAIILLIMFDVFVMFCHSLSYSYSNFGKQSIGKSCTALVVSSLVYKFTMTKRHSISLLHCLRQVRFSFQQIFDPFLFILDSLLQFLSSISFDNSIKLSEFERNRIALHLLRETLLPYQISNIIH